jgi:protein-disulfide isomerase
MLQRLRIAALLGFLSCGLAAAAVAAEPFSAEQRRGIERVIRDYLLANPELLVEAMQELENRRKAEAEAKTQRLVGELHPEIYRSRYDYVVNPSGRIPLVEFFDYQCGYCKRVFPALQQVREQERDVRVIYKEFPILGPVSVFAARAAIAARRQDKYLALHEAMMTLPGQLSEEAVLMAARQVGLDVERLQRDMKRPDVQEAIDFNLNLAQRLEIRGTPTMFVGQTLVPGAVPLDRLVGLIADARGNCSVC